MTPVRLEPAAPRSRVKHSTTALPLNKACCLLEQMCNKARIFLLVDLGGFFFRLRVGGGGDEKNK